MGEWLSYLTDWIGVIMAACLLRFLMLSLSAVVILRAEVSTDYDVDV